MGGEPLCNSLANALRAAGHQRGLFHRTWRAARSHTLTMLSLEDCIALSGLTEAEILAIAEHEHIPEIAAAELGNYLSRSADGQLTIKSMIRDDIQAAEARGERDRVLALKMVLRNYVSEQRRLD
jgi:hypothetical protein